MVLLEKCSEEVLEDMLKLVAARTKKTDRKKSRPT